MRTSKLQRTTVGGVFHRLVYSLGIARPQDKLRPRLHDLRFYFANQALISSLADQTASAATWSLSPRILGTATYGMVIGTSKQLPRSSQRLRLGARTLPMEATHDAACTFGHCLFPKASRR